MTKRVGGLGEWLTDVRGKRSQEEFAAQFGITRSTLANYESGRSKVREALIRRIADKDSVPMPLEQSDTAQAAWLVEHGPTHAPAYLKLANDWGWTLDPFKAFRCARQEDAEALARWHGSETHPTRVTEHGFVLDAAPGWDCL